MPAHRNRLLAEAFYLTGDIEKYGVGFIRVRELNKNFPDTKLNINEMGDFLMIGVAVTPTKTPTKTAVALTSLEQKIVNEIKKDHAITFNRIAAGLSISRYTVVEYVNKLKAKGVINRQGGARAGYWEILISDNLFSKILDTTLCCDYSGYIVMRFTLSFWRISCNQRMSAFGMPKCI